MSPDEPSRTVIGLKTALALYAVLVAASFLTLRGTARYLCLVIVIALAIKSYLHYLRSRTE
ncbi:MAG: hypothetical protein JOZ62_01775 [Acidobacteriaceae bacterium]|nr:hypothetical protein [Acidobacteriaceae bacterium]